MNDIKTYAKLQGDDLITGSIQDCTPYMERAQALQREGFHGSSDFKHAATLPLVIVEKYCNDNHITLREFMSGPEHVKRICNDPDHAYFRVWPGRL